MVFTVGMILDGPLKDDARVQKEARALEAAGYPVHILVPEQNPAEREIPGIKTERLYLPTGWRGLWRRFRAAWSFVDPAWEPAIEQFVKNRRIRALHVHDLPLVETARRVARKIGGVRVIADLHENYPYLLQRIVDTRKLRYRFVFGYERWKAHEAQVVNACDRTIVVIEEARERLGREARLPASKVAVVPNYEIYDKESPPPPPPGPLRLVYVGVLNDHRGLDTAIDAMSSVLAGGVPDAQLTIVGDGPERAKLEARAKEKGIAHWVHFLGWKSGAELKKAILEAHVGLVPHEKNPLTDATIPNKLFSYMNAERPVIVSSCDPLERIVKETGAGLVFKAGDAKDLARVAIELKEPARRATLGKAGREAVRTKYNWGEAARALCGLYDALTQ